MRKILVRSVFALALLASVAGLSHAQAPFRTPTGGGNSGLPPATVLQPQNSPLLSPYLNLLRGGNPAANYYLGVVPERARRANEAQLGSTVNQLIPDIGRLREEPLAPQDSGDFLTLPNTPIRGLPSQGFSTTPPLQFGPGSDVPRPRFSNGLPDARMILAPVNLPPRRIPVTP